MSDALQVALHDIADDATICAVYRLWDEKRGQRFAPTPAEMDVFALPRTALSNVVIVDVVDGGRRFRFRLIGSYVVSASGTDFTGRFTDEVLSGWMRDTVLAQYRAVAEKKRPGYAVAEFKPTSIRPIKNRRLALPLSSDGVAVDRLLLVSRASAPWLLQGDLLDIALASNPEVVRSFVMI